MCWSQASLEFVIINSSIKPDLRRQLEAHLQSCGDCRDELQSWKRSLNRLDAWKLPRTGPRLDAFRKQAHVLSYAGSPESGMPGSMGSGSFMGGFGGFGGGGGCEVIRKSKSSVMAGGFVVAFM